MFHEVFNFYVTFHSKKVIMWKKILLNHYFSLKSYLLERLDNLSPWTHTLCPCSKQKTLTLHCNSFSFH